MKKFLNGLGVFGSIILTIVLTLLIFIYSVVLNIKFMVSENGLARTFKKIDVVEILKSTKDGAVWEDFKQISNELKLNDEEFEEILNSKDIKEYVGSYISNVLNSMLSDEKIKLTKDEMEEFLNIVVDEYNKISDNDITDSERKDIVDSFDDESIANINNEINSIDLFDSIDSEYVIYIELLNNILFGNYTLIMLAVIIFIIGLIALFRFSYYKWMSYVKVSTIISGVLVLICGILLLIIPLENMEMLMPLRELFATKLFITSAILFILSVALTILNKIIKKRISNKENNSLEIVSKFEQ